QSSVFDQLLLTIGKHRVQHCFGEPGIKDVSDQSAIWVVFKAVIMAPIGKYAHWSIGADIRECIAIAETRKIMARGPPQPCWETKHGGAIGEPISLLKRSHRHKRWQQSRQRTFSRVPLPHLFPGCWNNV